MDNIYQNPTLGEAASKFLASLPAEEGARSQQAVYGFARWYGWGRPCADLSAHEVASYAEQLSLAQASYAQNLEITRAFCSMLRKRVGVRLTSPYTSKPGR